MSRIACRYDVAPNKRGPKSRRRSKTLVDDIHSRHRSRRRPAHAAAEEFLSSEKATEGSCIPEPPTTNSADISIPRANSADQSPSTLTERLQNVHKGLVLSLSSVDTSLSLETVVARCVDMYMQNTFCLHPIVHEGSLRAVMNLDTLVVQEVAAQPRTRSRDGSLHLLQSYALVTALCAATAYLLSPQTDVDGRLVGPVFLRVSRETLSIYHDLDLQQPESSSLAIRMFQAAALHTDGKHELAWHLFGEALRLADQMRLYDEQSFGLLDPLEGRLRRTAYWDLTAYAQYHHILEEFSLVTHTWNRERTTAMRLDYEPTDMFEEQLFAGFFAFHRLWEAASGLLLDLESYARVRRLTADAITLLEIQQNGLTESYVRFLTVLDHLPACIHYPDAGVNTENGNITLSQRRQFWIQRTNLFVTYHCLRMVLVTRISHLGLGVLIGIQDAEPMLALRKTEVAHDMICFITSVPLEILRVMGETCISKIRHVGASLLEIMNQVPATPATVRAKSLLPVLLDVLTRLDSRRNVSHLVNLNHSPIV